MIFLGGLLARIPALKWLAGIGLAFFVGLGLGNYIATERAVKEAAEIVAARDAADQAAQAKALLEQRSHDLQVIAQAQKTQREADEQAHLTLAATNAAARSDADRARAQLVSERTKTNEQIRLVSDLKSVNGMLADMAREPAHTAAPSVLLCGGPDTRRVLDEASGARDSGSGDAARGAEAAAASGINTEAQASADAPDLTCDQLLAGYVNLSEWGREGWAIVTAWQAWAGRALK